MNRQVEVDGAALVGTLQPACGGAMPGPVALLLGGTFSDLRDADPDPQVRPEVPSHRMYGWLAEGLSEAGIASFRFDRRGCGESTGERGLGRAREIDDAAEVWRWLQMQPECDGRVIAVGESAGAYVLCRLAARGLHPVVAVLQGALYRPIRGLLRYNLEQAARYIRSSPAADSWVRDHAPQVHAEVQLWPAIEVALARGESEAHGVVDGEPVVRDLSGLAYDVAWPPAEQFEHLRCPVLVLHGAEDMNVPVDDAVSTVRALWANGNRSVDLRIVAGADHSFQQLAADPVQRIRERLTLASFARPFHPDYPRVVVDHLAGWARAVA